MRYRVFRIQLFDRGHWSPILINEFNTLDEAIRACQNADGAGQNLVVDFGQRREDGSFSSQGNVVYAHQPK